MPEIKVDTIVDAAGTGKPNFSNGITINGAAVSTLNIGEYNASGTEPSSPQNGSIWWDTTNEKIFLYIDGEFKETIIIPAAVWYGSRGVIVGGTYPVQDTMDYITIQTTGNATDFGDLDTPRQDAGCFSDGTKGFAAKGYDGSNATKSVSFWTFATTGDASDFGDLVVTNQYGCGAACDGSRGLVAGNNMTGGEIDYIATATQGDGADFGDLTVVGRAAMGGNDATRAVFGGRQNSSSIVDVIDYNTIQTLGNSTDFGDLTTARKAGCSVGDTTRVVFAGGQPSGAGYSNVIDYITVQTTGNATDFGDTTQAFGGSGGGMSDASRGVYTSLAGGNYSNVIEYITIQTTGNATDFGDRNNTYSGITSTAGT